MSEDFGALHGVRLIRVEFRGVNDVWYTVALSQRELMPLIAKCMFRQCWPGVTADVHDERVITWNRVDI